MIFENIEIKKDMSISEIGDCLDGVLDLLKTCNDALVYEELDREALHCTMFETINILEGVIKQVKGKLKLNVDEEQIDKEPMPAGK